MRILKPSRLHKGLLRYTHPSGTLCWWVCEYTHSIRFTTQKGTFGFCKPFNVIFAPLLINNRGLAIKRLVVTPGGEFFSIIKLTLQKRVFVRPLTSKKKERKKWEILNLINKLLKHQLAHSLFFGTRKPPSTTVMPSSSSFFFYNFQFRSPSFIFNKTNILRALYGRVIKHKLQHRHNGMCTNQRDEPPVKTSC